MITATAVPITAFLGLQLPGSTLFGKISNDILIEDPWRLWIVILVVLTYQYWRFITDRDVQDAWLIIKDKFEQILTKTIENKIGSAVKRHFAGSWMRGYKIKLSEEVETPELIDWRKSKFSPGLTYLEGAAMPPSKRFNRKGEVPLGYALEYEGNKATAGTISVKYELPEFEFWTCAITASVKTFSRIQELQDIAIPTVLAFVSLTITLKNIICFD